MKIHVGCALCLETAEVEVDLPEGWMAHDGDIENELCPAHALAEGFRESQCPGCVEGWADCALWRSFAYSGQRNITEQDLATVERGICPRRTNGTFTLTKAGFGEMNLSERAPTEAGACLAQGIRDYMGRWPA